MSQQIESVSNFCLLFSGQYDEAIRAFSKMAIRDGDMFSPYPFGVLRKRPI